MVYLVNFIKLILISRINLFEDTSVLISEKKYGSGNHKILKFMFVKHIADEFKNQV